MKGKLLPVVIVFLVTLILTPSLVLGLVLHPWFFLLLFLLLLLFPLALAPKEASTRKPDWTRSPAVWVPAIAALVIALPALVVGFLFHPGLFLIVLLVLLPLLWVGFSE